MANEEIRSLFYTYQNYLFPVICLFSFILIFLIVIHAVSKRSKAKKYVNAFSNSYKSEEKVIIALQSASEAFHKNSKEAKAISKAVFYINNSILRDYKTAFGIVEKRIKGKKVTKLHREILEKEKEKKNTILLLTAK